LEVSDIHAYFHRGGHTQDIDLINDRDEASSARPSSGEINEHIAEEPLPLRLVVRLSGELFAV
jgi:hypothetical protein